MTKSYVAALDQGTTSTRAILFDEKGKIVATSQMEHRQIFPQAGWVEHDAREIWVKSLQVASGVMAKADIEPEQVAAIGITNQRETTIVWDRTTGKPIHNAIVWQDMRTAEICHELEAAGHGDLFRHRTGLPIATYFSGPKVKWILDNVEGARQKADAGELMFGTIDSWLIYKMSGGKKGGVHVTDVTNASRTMMMNLETLDWDPELAAILGIPMPMLPEIKPSSHVYGETGGKSLVPGIPVSGILGDQQAALFGQACLSPGEVKNTYGTGQFVLMNTGSEIFRSRNGLITTVAYQLGEDSPAVYALEGSVAVSGSLVQWLRDNLGLISSAPEIETLAKSVEDNGGAYIVPAFSGLFAPYWRDDARGVIVGLTRFVNKGHIARAALESVAHQSVDVIEAMNADSGVPIRALKVDGGMVVNDLLMQFQADIADVPVIRPKVAETTALGAAYAAGLAVGYWKSTDEIVANWAEDCRWEPSMADDHRAGLRKDWAKAVQRTLDWAE